MLSLNRGTLVQTSKYYSPYYGDPQNGLPLILGNPHFKLSGLWGSGFRCRVCIRGGTWGSPFQTKNPFDRKVPLNKRDLKFRKTPHGLGSEYYTTVVTRGRGAVLTLTVSYGSLRVDDARAAVQSSDWIGRGQSKLTGFRV